MPDIKLTHAQAVRAEAMRLPIQAASPFGDDASFAGLVAMAETIEAWL